jgi:O2-independent ubiquinone biosynthesis accessory factor UbiT
MAGRAWSRSSAPSPAERMRDLLPDIDLMRPIRLVLGRLPQRPPTLLLATALNWGLAVRLDVAALERLRGRLIRIVVHDLGLVLSLAIDERGFRACSSKAPADVTISASAADFRLLALRREDPDTLFFSRRLRMEGDTA